MPTSSWRCSPCESSATSTSSLSVRPTASAIARPRSRISPSARVLARSRKWPSCTPSTARYRLSSTDRPPNRRDVWNVRERPTAGALARRQRGHVVAEQLDRAGRRRELARDQVEQRGLAGPVGPEDRAPLAGPDVEVDARDGDDAAEAPADPPQAEDRRGGFGGCRGSCHRLPSRSRPPRRCPPTAAGCPSRTSGSRGPAPGCPALNTPPNVWSTSGMRLSVWTSGTPSPVLSATIFFTNTFEIAWRLSSSLTSPHGASSPDSVVALSASCSAFWSETSPSTSLERLHQRRAGRCSSRT